MKIKEILPFTIESPVIHLVQPSPTIPLGHEVVFQQSSSNGGGVNAIYALAAQEKKVRRQRKVPQERGKEFNEKEESNLSCGFISPPIHQAADDKKKKKSSFYDLRNNRSLSIAVETPEPRLSPTLSARSKSLDDSPTPERRKKSPNFEDILRELGCSSRTSDAGESTTSKVSSGGSESGNGKDDVTRKCSVASSDSVFYDISLDDRDVEKSSPEVEITPRKSFSEETFDRNRSNMSKNRSKILENMRTKWRTISSDSCDESYEEAWNNLRPSDKRRVSQMVDDLLVEIYGDKGIRPVRRRSCTGILRGRSPGLEDSYYDSLYEDNTCCTEYTSGSEGFRLAYLQQKKVPELAKMVRSLQADVKRLGGRLVKQLIRRDCLVAKRDWHCNWITAYLQANSEKRSEYHIG